MVKNFTRTIEDFVCDVCETSVSGDGYTNHCPTCLSSKHVDINPGDRASDCGGVMIAVGYEQRNGKEWILHRCEKCGFERRNKVTSHDSRKAIQALSCGQMDFYLQRIRS
ncbi:MAG: RNHCP domain-containing protein [Alphaproteobacteria bacterium]|nr:RNHCP domain-containing protein [Alphaproteobacteria bacterium]MBQ3116930.1 RNHCP domain-containing protein [Alphaproteobacteria bacterium]MBR3913498.1 RNHCP domain-containing protein [Alphaproteobacteria bacterium]MBR4932111.1 RNHCP domain-containing protein [Alphaproteobacteria bacterium]